MLELPYLETFAGLFEKKFKNRVLNKIDVKHRKSINLDLAAIEQKLLGRELKQVWREGLSVMFRFDSNDVLEVLIADTARFQLMDDCSHSATDYLNLYFNDHQILSVTGQKKLAVLNLNFTKTSVPDVMSKEFSMEYFINLLSGSDEEIRSLLINQDKIRGIGERYVDEILWFANISPFSVAGKVPSSVARSLYKTIKYTLLDAVKHVKKIQPDSLAELMEDSFVIHNTDKKYSPTGESIRAKVWSGKLTYYTDEQQLYS